MSDIKLPARPKDGHKGTFGTVAIFAGHISDESVMLGSAVFAAKAALQSGVGLVDFFADKQTLIELIKMLPQATGHTYKSFDESSDKWSSIIVGPGWESTKENILILQKILKLKKPTIIDGEALNILASNIGLLKLLHAKCILTPHAGEYERLSKTTKISDPKSFAKKYGCVLVVKSNITTVSDGKNLWRFAGNNPKLATGGTGDILSGLIGGLVAQKHHHLSTYEAAKLSVKLHSQNLNILKS